LHIIPLAFQEVPTICSSALLEKRSHFTQGRRAYLAAVGELLVIGAFPEISPKDLDIHIARFSDEAGNVNVIPHDIWSGVEKLKYILPSQCGPK
jgi:hypothetical protein